MVSTRLLFLKRLEIKKFKKCILFIFVSILCDVDIQELPKVGKKVGIDVGLKTFAVCSDGYRVANLKHFRKVEKRLAKLQKDLARKEYNSKNYHKNRIMIAKLHKKIVN